MKRKSLIATLLAVGLSCVFLGLSLPLFNQKQKAEATASEIRPYVEYAFDDSSDQFKNTGTSAGSYGLTKYGGDIWYADDVGDGGHLYFSENAVLYLTDANNFFKNLTDFTITVDVNAEKNSWYGSLFSFDSFTSYASDGTGSTTMAQYNRISMKGSSGADWFRFSDKKLTASNTGAQWENYTKGTTLYTGGSGSSSGLITIVYSLKAGKTLKIKAYSGSTQVGSLSYDISSWTLYNAASTFKTFMLGGVNDTRYWDGTKTTGPQQKMKGTVDNFRVYNFAMDSYQMAEYAVNKSISNSSELRPYVEYAFNDTSSAANFLKNTGISASDTSVNYDLQSYGQINSSMNANGYLDAHDDTVLYLEEANNFFTSLDDFTIAVDVDAAKSSWFSSLFSFDSFSTVGSGSVEKYTRLETKYWNGSTTVGDHWLKFGDSSIANTGSTPGIVEDWSYSRGTTLYTGTDAGGQWTNSGLVTVVFSFESNVSLKIKVYSGGSQVGSVSYDRDDIYGWTLYNEASTHKKFMIGGHYKPSNYTNESTFSPQGKIRSAIDNFRVYNYAMSDAQMADYGTYKSIKAFVTDGAEIRPYVEYTFDYDNADSGKFFKNTGTSANDTSKNYDLQDFGNGYVINSSYGGYLDLNDNDVLYLSGDKNFFANELYNKDFTIAVDVDAGKSSWYSSLFSFDSFTSYASDGTGSTTMAQYNRISMKYSSGADWFRFCDKSLTAAGAGAQWENYTKGTTLYTGGSDATSGNVTIVYSLDAGSTLKIKVYSGSTQVGSLSYDISSWTLYNAGSTFKTFVLGGCNDTRYWNGTKQRPTAAQQKMKGAVDNFRVYDFAMSDAQMAEYAANKKLVSTSVHVTTNRDEADNGTVYINSNPVVGQNLGFTAVPDDGYFLKSLVVNGKAITPTDGEYKAKMVSGGLTVQPIFESTDYLNIDEKLADSLNMKYGASVRYGGTFDYSGLRFGMEMTGSDYSSISADATAANLTVSYGILIIPADYQKTYGAFTVENLFGASAIYYPLAQGETYTGSLVKVRNIPTADLSAKNCDDPTNPDVVDGNYHFYGTLANIKPENLAKSFVGVGYAKIQPSSGDPTYVLANFAADTADGAKNNIRNNTRSVYQVAKLSVLLDGLTGNKETFITENYIGRVENLVDDVAGKKLSVMGDSISTCADVSNNSGVNSTIGGNEVFYTSSVLTAMEMTVNDTWWQQAITDIGLERCVINAWSGSDVSDHWDTDKVPNRGGCTNRSYNLHKDVGGTVNPDIIAVYIGINDIGADLGDYTFILGDSDSIDISGDWNSTTNKYGNTKKSFANAYATMIKRIMTTYDEAQLFLFTLPRNGYTWGGTKAEYNVLQDQYNDAICNIADKFNLPIVDLATAVGNNWEDLLRTDDKIHPRKAGMDMIATAFEIGMYSYYFNK